MAFNTYEWRRKFGPWVVYKSSPHPTINGLLKRYTFGNFCEPELYKDFWSVLKEAQSGGVASSISLAVFFSCRKEGMLHLVWTDITKLFPISVICEWKWVRTPCNSTSAFRYKAKVSKSHLVRTKMMNTFPICMRRYSRLVTFWTLPNYCKLCQLSNFSPLNFLTERKFRFSLVGFKHMGQASEVNRTWERRF